MPGLFKLEIVLKSGCGGGCGLSGFESDQSVAIKVGEMLVKGLHLV